MALRGTQTDDMVHHVDQERWSDAVAETIRAERAAAQLSQAELAHRAGIPRMSYIRYETGVRRPSLVQVAQIAQALNVPLSTFARRVEERAEMQGK